MRKIQCHIARKIQCHIARQRYVALYLARTAYSDPVVVISSNKRGAFVKRNDTGRIAVPLLKFLMLEHDASATVGRKRRP